MFCWYLQIHPGHAVLEKRRPALMDSVVQVRLPPWGGGGVAIFRCGCALGGGGGGSLIQVRLRPGVCVG